MPVFDIIRWPWLETVLVIFIIQTNFILGGAASSLSLHLSSRVFLHAGIWFEQGVSPPHPIF